MEHFNGLSMAARSAHRAGRASRKMGVSVDRLDAAHRVARHLNAIKAREFATEFCLCLPCSLLALPRRVAGTCVEDGGTEEQIVGRGDMQELNVEHDGMQELCMSGPTSSAGPASVVGGRPLRRASAMW